MRSRVLALPAAALWWAFAALAQPGGITTGGATQRPILVRGKVALSDGRMPPEKAEIELVCKEQAQPQGKADANGDFSIQLGLYRFEGASNASVGSAAAGSGFGGALSGQTQVDGGSIMSLMGCSLRASLRGYRSDLADLSRVRVGEPVNVGTIILHRLEGGGGAATVSATSLAAPKNARQSLEKARQKLAAGQPAEAEKELRKAVQLYPKYAEAWQELGSLLLSQKNAADARKAFLEALACDSRYPKPYLSLARLSATERNWKDALEQSAALLRIDPESYPQGYYYNAVAHYNLDAYDQALQSARRAVELDAAHTVPLAEQLLGLLYSMRGDYKSAVEQYRNYIQHVPPGTNVDAVKKRLAEAEASLEKSGK